MKIALGISPIFHRGGIDWSRYWTQPEFALELTTTTPNKSVALPLLQNFDGGANFSYNFTVDWGDGNTGTVTSYNDADATHIYVAAGTYIIKIAGTCESFYINEYIVAGTDGTKELWTKVLGWGDVGLKKVCFCNCVNLRQIPPDKTGGLAGITDTNYMFHQASTITAAQGITSIPVGLFDYCVNVTSHHYTFHGTYITSIPESLFATNTLVDTFQTCFEYCRALKIIPADLFRYNTAVTNFRWVFNDCAELETIPAGLFDYNTAAEIFNQSFGGNLKLTTVPAHLFDNCTEVTTFEALFHKCESLTTLPSDLFRYNTKVTTFKNLLSGAKKFTTIPTDLFRYNVLATTFFDAFSGTAITSIPTDLFRYNTAVTDFTNVFKDCLLLEAIPADIFRYNTSVTTFLQSFINCDALTTIVADLFRYNVLAEIFKSTFDGCRLLAAIPASIFQYNTAATDFSYCFNEDANIYGNAPALWTAFPTATSTDCFKNCIHITNYPYIPIAWGGLGYTAMVKNGSFDSDTDWTKLTGTSIGSGIATIAALGPLSGSSGNWSLNQTPNENIEDGDVINVSFKARIVSGSGSFQFAIGYEVYFNQAITGTMTTYSFEMTRNVIVSNYKIIFGGATAGNTFELDDVVITRVV